MAMTLDQNTNTNIGELQAIHEHIFTFKITIRLAQHYLNFDNAPMS
jgi:hypothetical protein